MPDLFPTDLNVRRSQVFASKTPPSRTTGTRRQFSSQLNPAVAAAFGFKPETTPQDLLASAYGLDVPSADQTSGTAIAPKLAPVQSAPVVDEDSPVEIPMEQVEIPDELSRPSNLDGSELDPAQLETPDPFWNQTDEQLAAPESGFNPARYLDELWASGKTYDADTEARLARIYDLQRQRGWDLSTMAKNAIKGGPAVVKDFILSVPSLGVNTWEALAGNTPEEKVKAFSNLVGALDISSSENAGLLIKASPLLRGIAEAAATEGGILEKAKAGAAGLYKGVRELEGMAASVGDRMRTMVGLSSTRTPLPEKDAISALRDSAGNYANLRKTRAGQGVLTELAGASAADLKKMGIELTDADLIERDRLSIPLDISNAIPFGAGFKVVNPRTGRMLAAAATKSAAAQAIEVINKRFVRPVAEYARGKVSGVVTKVGAGAEAFGKFTKKKLVEGIAAGAAVGAGLTSGSLVPAVTALGAYFGARTTEGIGRRLKQAGIQFGQHAGPIEWAKNLSGDVGRGVLGGYVMAAPLAALAEDEEMAAGILSSGMLGGLGAVTGRVSEAGKSKVGQWLSRSYEEVGKAPIASPDYNAGGNPDVTVLNNLHRQQIARMVASPVGRQAVNVINRLRETFRTVLDPSTGTAVPTRIWVLPRDQFETRFGNQQGYFRQQTGAGFDIYLNEDATGGYHEVGHLLQSLMEGRGLDEFHEAIRQAYGDRVDEFRQFYNAAYNQGRAPGTPEVDIGENGAVNEIGSELMSLMLRGVDLTGQPEAVRGQTLERVGAFLETLDVSNKLGLNKLAERLGVEPDQPGLSWLKPEIGSRAPSASPLGVEPSRAAIQTGRETVTRLGLLQPATVIAPGASGPSKGSAGPTPAAPTPATPSGGPASAPVAPAPAPSPAPLALAPVAPATPATPAAPGLPAGTVPGAPAAPRAVPVSAESPEERKSRNMRGAQADKLTEALINDPNAWAAEAERILSDPEVPEDQKAVVRALASGAQGPDNVIATLDYSSVKPKHGGALHERWERREEQGRAYEAELADPNAKEETRDLFSKNLIPTRIVVRQRKNPDGTTSKNINIIGKSPDKILGNLTLLLNAVQSNASLRTLAPRMFPADWEFSVSPDGRYRFTTAGLNSIARDLVAYSNNLQNGYTGTGTPISVPAGYQGYVPVPAPGFKPTAMDVARAETLNLVMGEAPPTTTAKMDRTVRTNPATGEKITIPRNVEAQRLREVNPQVGEPAQPLGSARLTIEQAKAQGLPWKKKADVVTVSEGGPMPRFEVPELGGARFPIMETNPLRAELADRGFDPKSVLSEVSEELNLEDVEAGPSGSGIQVRPTPMGDLPSNLLAAGFMPRPEAFRSLYDVSKMSPDEFSAWAAREASPEKGGLTGQAYRIGISLAGDRESATSILRGLQSANDAMRDSLMAQDNLDGAIVLANRGQFYREVSEVINDSGSMQGVSTLMPVQDELFLVHPKFEETLSRVRSGEAFGETLNADGTTTDFSKFIEPGQYDEKTYAPIPEKLDVVSVASVNIPLSQLTPNRVRGAVAPFVDALKNPRVKIGVFKLDAVDPKFGPMVSVDVNALINQSHRAATLEFARRNNQQAIWDAAKSEVISTGGNGDTVITDPAEVVSAAEGLIAGKPPKLPERGALREAAMPGRYDETLSLEDRLVSEALELPKLSWLHSFFLSPEGRLYDAQVHWDFADQFIDKDSKDPVIASLQKGWVRINVSPQDSEILIQGRPNPRQTTVLGDLSESQKAPVVRDDGRVFLDRSESGSFMPKKPDWEKLERAALRKARTRRQAIPKLDKTPAVWITPASELVPVTQNTHENYLAENAGGLNGRFGTDFSTEPAVEERNKALSAGFVRIRHRNDGALVVEGTPEALAKQRQNILDVVEANRGDVYRMQATSMRVGKRGTVIPVDSVSDTFYDFGSGEQLSDPVAGAENVLDSLGNRGASKAAAMPVVSKAAAEEFAKDSVVTTPLFHGSNSKFKDFRIPDETKRFVLWSEFKVKPQGVFFTADPADAKQYGRNVYEVRANLKNPFIHPERDANGGLHLNDDKQREVAEVVAKAAQKDDSGNSYIDVGVKRVYLPDNPAEDVDWSTQVGDGNGLHWDLLDNPEIIGEIKKRGYDGTYAFEPEHSDAQSVMVFSPDQVQIVDPTESVLYEPPEGFDDEYYMPKPSEALEQYRTLFAALPPKAREELRGNLLKVWADDEIASNSENPEALPLQITRDDNGVPQVAKSGDLNYASVPYRLTESRAAKEISSRLSKKLKPRERQLALEDKVTDVLGDRLAEEYNSVSDARVKLGKLWYDLAERLLKSVFKDDFVAFAQLLAATSPQTGVRENFLYALDAYNQLKSGKYDDWINRGREAVAKFQSGDPEVLAEFGKDAGKLDEQDAKTAFIVWWINNKGGQPLRSDGSKFGANSTSVGRVLLGDWNERAGGLKTAQFTGNLTGLDLGPTIDVWAVRAAHRVLNKGSKRWLIPPKNEAGITDVDYRVAAEGYRKASAKLGLDPRQLQAILWFNEKKLWDDKGWTRTIGRKLSSFVEFLESVRRKPTGELVVQPDPNAELAALDLTLPEAERMQVPPALANAPVEAFGSPSPVEEKLRQKLAGLAQPELQLK